MKISSKQKCSFRKWIYQSLIRVAYTLLILTIGQSIFAQNASQKNRFSVDNIRGCAPLTVNLTDLGTVVDNNAPILVHFNRDPADRESLAGIINSMLTGASLDTTYTEPGTYLIGQVNGNVADATDRFDFIEVIVTESVAPVFDVSTCTNNNIVIDIDFAMDSYDGYSIDFGDGQSTTLDKSGSNIINHGYGSQNNYSITIAGTLSNGHNTACGSTTSTITTVVDLPLPTITELSVESVSSAMLTYSMLDPNLDYQLEIDDGNGFQQVTTLSPIDNTSSYLFDDVLFDFISNTYTFRILVSETCGNSTGHSNEIPSISLTYSSAYNNTQIDIVFDWLTSASGLTELFIIRNSNIDGTSTEPTGRVLVNLDNCASPITFRVEGNFSGSTSLSLAQIPDLANNLTPPTLNTPEIVFSSGNILVRWDASIISAAEYLIYRQNSDGDYELVGNTNAIQYDDAGLNPSTRQVCYRVSYLDDCGNESELSEEVCESLSGQVLVPNAFSPNGDGLNDTFKVLDGIYRNFQMSIYNRWGGLVFASTNAANGWDGTLEGQLSPSGSYIYRIQYFDSSDRLTSLSGSFLLIR